MKIRDVVARQVVEGVAVAGSAVDAGECDGKVLLQNGSAHSSILPRGYVNVVTFWPISSSMRVMLVCRSAEMREM